MASKRVLIFSLVYYPLVGGAEVAIRELTDRIADIEFDMVTMLLDKNLPKFERIGNVNVYRVGSGASYLNKVLFVPGAAFKAWRLNRERKYDLFWAMMTNMTFPIALMRLVGNRTPYIITLQDGDPFERVFERWRIRLVKPLLVRGFKEAKVIQAISHFLASWTKKLGYEGRVEVIPNGVDSKKFAEQDPPVHGQEGNSRQDPVRLITTSRLVEKNGINDVIEALKYLPENVHFNILGIGPLENSLKLKIKNLKLEHRVHMFGHVDQEHIPAYLHQSDIFIRPSLSEGQGISFIEAMAAGLPVLATEVGGIPDFLFDPDKTPERPPTGLFVNVRDPKSIAKQVERLMNNPNLRETLIANGKRLVREKYDWNLLAEAMKKRVFLA